MRIHLHLSPYALLFFYLFFTDYIFLINIFYLISKNLDFNFRLEDNKKIKALINYDINN